MLLSLLLIAFGVVLLVVGADALVSGASRIAQRFGIPPLIVGLTIVAIGTSMPEITVSTTAALTGSTELALGNVVGSNIFNVLLILGIAATILPLSVQVSLVRQEVPVMLGLSVLLFVLILDGSLVTIEAGLLLALGIGYLALLVVQARRAARAGENVEVDLPDPTGWLAKVPSALLIGVGLVGLVGGAQLLVRDASAIALSLGVSELVVGLTVVAIGTSLPEVAASVAAVLLCWCVVYLVWTVLAATTSPMLGAFSGVALYGLLPATAVFLAATVVMALRGPNRPGPRTGAGS